MRTLTLLLLFVLYTQGKNIDSLDEKVKILDNIFQQVQDDIDSLESDFANNNKKDDQVDEGDIFDKIAKVNENENVEGVYEGDIKQRPDEDITKRNAIFNRNNLWTTKDIPYVFDGFSETSKQVVRAAHKAISDVSCIKFHEKTATDPYYLKYFVGGGCYSYVGLYKSSARNGQPVSLGSGCVYVGIAIHETLHALGFYHEQSRYDRDQFVEIFWENIMDGREGNFKKLTRQNSDNSKTAYDYDGIMHYGKTSFSKNGKPTILSISNPAQQLGQRNGLSKVDADQLYKIYDCTNTKTGWSSWSDWTPCSSSCSSIRQRFCFSDNYNGECPGNNQERKQCTAEECKMDGHWGKWSSFTTCDAPRCGSGSTTRTRKCDDPAPQSGGKKCIGDGIQKVTCNPGCPEKCTMDTGVCEYTLDGTWTHTGDRTPSSSTGPTTDASGTGKYVYMEASGGAPAEESDLTSPSFPASSAGCLRFEYHMYGQSMGELRVSIIRGNNAAEQISKITGDQGNSWISRSIDISSSVSSFKIQFKAIRGTSWSSDIAVDNIFMENGKCNGGPSPATTGAPPPVVTTSTEAPPPVVTTSTEAPPPVITTTTVATPPVVTTGPPQPATTGMPPPVTTGPPQPATTGMPPPLTTEPSQPATTGPPQPATTGPPQATTGIPSVTTGPIITTEEPIVTTSDPIREVGFSCNFDNDLCGIKQSNSSSLKWISNAGQTRSGNTGPTQDRSSKSGKYLYIEASRKRKGDSATLVYDYTSQSGDEDQCLEFFYHMYGSGMGNLIVNNKNALGVETELLKVEGNQGNEWHQVLLPLTGKVSQISVTGVRGNDYRSDIAIDDIRIIPTACPTNRKTSTILSCSFESLTCAWNISNGDFNWKRTSGSTPTYNTGPSRAVTGGYRDYYVFTEASSSSEYDVAKMTSPVVRSISNTCFRFFVNMNGANIGRLDVIKMTAGGDEEYLWSKEGSQGVAWFEGQVTLPASSEDYQIQFQATSKGVRGDIAIDNILVENGKCIEEKHVSSSCDFDGACDIKFFAPSAIKDCPSNIQKVAVSPTSGANTFQSWNITTCNSKESFLRMNLKNLLSRGSCLSFKYFIKNSRYCDINIYGVTTVRGRERRSRIARVRDGSENLWIPYQANLSLGPDSQKVQISTKINQGCKYFAVDDINVTDGLC